MAKWETAQTIFASISAASIISMYIYVILIPKSGISLVDVLSITFMLPQYITLVCAIYADGGIVERLDKVKVPFVGTLLAYIILVMGLMHLAACASCIVIMVDIGVKKWLSTCYLILMATVNLVLGVCSCVVFLIGFEAETRQIRNYNRILSLGQANYLKIASLYPYTESTKPQLEQHIQNLYTQERLEYFPGADPLYKSLLSMFILNHPPIEGRNRCTLCDEYIDDKNRGVETQCCHKLMHGSCLLAISAARIRCSFCGLKTLKIFINDGKNN